MNNYIIVYPNELNHFGVRGMKWGVRKDYRANSIRSAIARRQNAKVDKGFQKWKTGSDNKQAAISAGKKRNDSKLAYESNKKDKTLKAQYKQDNKAYKQALKQNTTYRKGSVREEVGKDMSRKYMSAAKNAKKAGDMKTYSKMMNKHDVERARARKAQSVGAARSQRKANFKRAMTMSVKAAATAAVVGAGVKYAKSKGVNISIDQVNNASSYLKTAKKFMSYMY